MAQLKASVRVKDAVLMMVGLVWKVMEVSDEERS